MPEILYASASHNYYNWSNFFSGVQFTINSCAHNIIIVNSTSVFRNTKCDDNILIDADAKR